MSAKTKTPKLKPRRMWFDPQMRYFCTRPNMGLHLPSSALFVEMNIPVVLIPLDDVEGLVAKAIAAYWENSSDDFTGNMRTALRAIGIPVPCKKEGRK